MAYTTEGLHSGAAGNRLSEKAQLQNFSDRFSNYIKNVRAMREHLNQADPTSRIHRLEEEVVAARNMYDQEINTLREQMNLSSRDRSRVEISNHQNSQLATEYQDRLIRMNTELMKKDEEMRNLQLYMAQKEADLLALRTSKTSPLVQLDLAKRELEDLHRSMMLCQKTYEEEFAMRQKLQEQLWECKDQLQYEKDLHLKESQEMRERVARSEMLILQLEEKLRAVSRPDPVLIETVQKIQESSEAEMKRFQEETERVYNQSLMDLEMRLHNEQGTLEHVQEENQNLHRHVDALTSEISTLGRKLLSEEANNGAFIDKLELEHIRSLQQIRSLEARLEEMQDLLLAKMKALDSYQETNVSLQSELKFLKEMLEEEEQHMDHVQTPHPSSTLTLPTVTSTCLVEPSLTSSQKNIPEHSKTSMPDLEAPLPPIKAEAPPKSYGSSKSAGSLASKEEEKIAAAGPTELRKRTGSLPILETNVIGQGPDYFNSLFNDLKKGAFHQKSGEKKEQSSSSAEGYNAATSSATGNLKIAEVHPNGHFVRLFNSSLDTEDDVGGYLLQQNVRGYPVSMYRFPPKMRVRANAALLVWAAEANATHNPPSDLVWKELSKFGTGPEYTTILCKPSGQAVAWYTPVRWSKPLMYEPCETPDEVQSDSQLTDRNENYQDSVIHEADQGGSVKMMSKANTPMLESTLKQPMEGATPVLVRREKGPPKILPPISSPWTQSTALPTHPDFSIARTATMGSDGSSVCQQSRAQTAAPERVPRSLYGRNQICKNADVLLGRANRGPTRSAGPNSRGVMYLGSTVPSGSPLQKYFANSSYNIRLPSQASLTPSIFSNI
ncbi:lamin tail domain-containing protein 1 isoform X2 [Ambystoma mexicanum]|uniref:lamin tail domain-containing protein 1 isoform X2 n=1 Tax=Ambystoma mexicanum TaxID=8296 RepID=UPI0037E9A2E5